MHPSGSEIKLVCAETIQNNIIPLTQGSISRIVADYVATNSIATYAICAHRGSYSDGNNNHGIAFTVVGVG